MSVRRAPRRDSPTRAAHVGLTDARGVAASARRLLAGPTHAIPWHSTYSCARLDAAAPRVEPWPGALHRAQRITVNARAKGCRALAAPAAPPPQSGCACQRRAASTRVCQRRCRNSVHGGARAAGVPARVAALTQTGPQGTAAAATALLPAAARGVAPARILAMLISPTNHNITAISVRGPLRRRGRRRAQLAQLDMRWLHLVGSAHARDGRKVRR